MKAIRTKYVGPTNTKGARITAVDMLDGHKVSISYDHGMSDIALHHAAAKALCDKMNWNVSLVHGGAKDGYVFVTVNKG